MLVQESIKFVFPEMPETSKIWIYQANRPMTDEEVVLISKKASDFTLGWESHGSKLKANFTVLYTFFIVFSVDENQHEASGCSIDKSVHFVKELEVLTGIRFFDRTNIAYLNNDNSPYLTPLSNIKTALELGYINNKTLIFNNLIDDLGKFRTDWLIPADSSWLSRFF